MSRWRSVALAGTLALSLAVWAGLPARELSPVALAVALALGVPHGAFDVELLLGPERQVHWERLGAYALVVAIVAAGWGLLPGIATVVFLFASVWHFGEGDVRGLMGLEPDVALTISRGLAVVGIPVVAHWPSTRPILDAMAGQPGLPELPAAAGVGVAAMLAIQHLVMQACRRVTPWRMWEAIALVAALMITPPLMGFAIYFGCWHAPSHIGQVLAARRSAPDRLCRALEVGSAMVGVGLVAAGWWMSSHAGEAASPTAVASGLVALASLTLPHVLVVEHWRRRRTGGAPDGEMVPS